MIQSQKQQTQPRGAQPEGAAQGVKEDEQGQQPQQHRDRPGRDRADAHQPEHSGLQSIEERHDQGVVELIGLRLSEEDAVAGVVEVEALIGEERAAPGEARIGIGIQRHTTQHHHQQYRRTQP